MEEQKEQKDREWRCRKCGTLLGVERRGRLHLKYKTAQYVVTGSVKAVCRRCTEFNETVCPSVTPVANGRAA